MLEHNSLPNVYLAWLDFYDDAMTTGDVGTVFFHEQDDSWRRF